MKIRLDYICGTIIEMTVEDSGTTLMTQVTNYDSIVSSRLIANLRDIADELEEHNKAVKMQTK